MSNAKLQKPMGRPRVLAGLTLAGLLLAGSRAAAAVLPGWNTNLAAALEQAQPEQQPVLAYFTASWCGPCKLMARTTFSNETVTAALASVRHVVVDIDEFPKLAEAHEVRAVPTFQLLSPAGEEVIRLTGYQGPEEFVGWLTNGIAEARAAAVRRQHSQAELQAADRLLAAGDSESLRQAAARLFGPGAERDPAIAKAVAQRLKAIARREPAALLPGLEHPRLAVRILAANLLREQLGEAFEVDPWSAAPTRTNGVARWREKLTAVKAEQEPERSADRQP